MPPRVERQALGIHRRIWDNEYRDWTIKCGDLLK